MKALPNKEKKYSSLITDIGILLEHGRRQAYHAVNSILVKTYWEIGRRIVDYEQKGKKRAEYGSSLLDTLSSDLTKQFGKGFSRDNLEKMRRFYQLFKNSETVSRKLSWSHYCLLFRVENELARKFYLTETENESWSVRELERQINSMLFERLGLSNDKNKLIRISRKGQLIEKPKDLVKDPYILEFLDLEEKSIYTEIDLENSIIDNMQKFLLELGKGFMFVDRQKRITLEDDHFYIDLVFYNRILRCFVLIELKIGKLTHRDLGQLQMYVNYYDRNIKSENENNTVGILLCADKKEAIVKYTLPKDNRQIFASEYKLYLPDKKELEIKLKRLLESKKKQ
ncbi:MAG: PDDEXK nuclease domain-containing protein [Nanoarchaeota archaeon]|nr:PDDEXK nuclease domain-containing protein [Nanoarchaeota archaeon]